MKKEIYNHIGWNAEAIKYIESLPLCKDHCKRGWGSTCMYALRSNSDTAKKCGIAIDGKTHCNGEWVGWKED